MMRQIASPRSALRTRWLAPVLTLAALAATPGCQQQNGSTATTTQSTENPQPASEQDRQASGMTDRDTQRAKEALAEDARRGNRPARPAAPDNRAGGTQSVNQPRIGKP